jgi:hypothetical protein
MTVFSLVSISFDPRIFSSVYSILRSLSSCVFPFAIDAALNLIILKGLNAAIFSLYISSFQARQKKYCNSHVCFDRLPCFMPICNSLTVYFMFKSFFNLGIEDCWQLCFEEMIDLTLMVICEGL